VVLTSHLVDLNYLTLSKRVWDRMTPAQQATLQKAANDAAESGRQKQLALEGELEAFFKEKGLKVYTPNLDAFRKQVQEAYLKSDLAKNWEKGALEKINAL
jgi:TRAP-type C4-dicarboxylate transport system substrate-binding protein